MGRKKSTAYTEGSCWNWRSHWDTFRERREEERETEKCVKVGTCIDICVYIVHIHTP